MTPQVSEIRETIERAVQEFVNAYNRGDAAGMASLYTEDSQLMPPNFDLVRGKEAIRNFWQGVMDMGIKSVQIDIGEVEQQGDTLYEVSQAKLFDANKGILDEVKYIVVWKREGGNWKLHRDIFNSNRPTQ